MRTLSALTAGQASNIHYYFNDATTTALSTDSATNVVNVARRRVATAHHLSACAGAAIALASTLLVLHMLAVRVLAKTFDTKQNTHFSVPRLASEILFDFDANGDANKKCKLRAVRTRSLSIICTRLRGVWFVESRRWCTCTWCSRRRASLTKPSLWRLRYWFIKYSCAEFLVVTKFVRSVLIQCVAACVRRIVKPRKSSPMANDVSISSWQSAEHAKSNTYRQRRKHAGV